MCRCACTRIDLKRAARRQFSGRPGRKNRRVRVTKRKMYRACCHRTLTWRWRNKRTGADDWPITRWPGYLGWYRLTVECSCSHDHQTRRHLVCVTPFSLHSPLFSDRRPSNSIVCNTRSLVSLVLTRLRLSSPLVSSLNRSTCPSIHPSVTSLLVSATQQNWIYDFIFLLCGRRLSADCSLKALLRITTT